MSKTYYNSNNEEVSLVETKDISKLKFVEFYILDEFGIYDPIEGLKKIYTRIPTNAGYPIFIYLHCGAMYTAIVQKASNDYLSAIIFGYSAARITFLKKVLEQWVAI